MYIALGRENAAAVDIENDRSSSHHRSLRLLGRWRHDCFVAALGEADDTGSGGPPRFVGQQRSLPRTNTLRTAIEFSSVCRGLSTQVADTYHIPVVSACVCW